MARIFLTIFIFSQYVLFSQINGGEIIYGMEGATITNKSDNYKEKKLYEMVKEAADKFEFQLLFNNEVSEFKKIESMAVGNAIQDKIKSIADIYNDGNTQALKNLKTKELIIKKNGFNILDINNSLEWELTTETKKIGDINAYKAILKNKSKVVAWYAPSIPFGYGPLEYNSLPGIILELHTGRNSFRAKKVVLNSKKAQNLKWPKDIITISKEKYSSLGNAAYKAIKN